MNEMVCAYAKQLGLPTFARADDLIRAAREGAWSYEEFLSQLMAGELTQRRENRLQRLTRAAKFPLAKSLDTFDFRRLPHLDASQVWQLACGEFVKRCENVIAIGNPGTGKTHLAIGLGRRLCREGFKVRFYTAAGLVEELSEARENRRLSRLHAQLLKLDVLILDELSYLTFSKAQAELLFHVLSDRNERGSVIITTNLEFSRWNELFPDTMFTGALVDRLTHHGHILNMNGDSYRLASRLQEEKDKTINPVSGEE